MSSDVIKVTNFINLKQSQVIDACESIGCIVGGGKGAGAVVSIVIVSVPIAVAIIQKTVDRNKQAKKNILTKEILLKQDGQIKILKKQADKCNGYQKFENK